VANQLADARRFRALTIMDVFTRESLAIEVGQRLKGEEQRLKGEDVVTLNQIRQQRGVPKFLFCGNGSGFTSSDHGSVGISQQDVDRLLAARQAKRQRARGVVERHPWAECLENQNQC
jgi:hypothetical protein